MLDTSVDLHLLGEASRGGGVAGALFCARAAVEVLSPALPSHVRGGLRLPSQFMLDGLRSKVCGLRFTVEDVGFSVHGTILTAVEVHGYLAHQKRPPPRTLQ